MTITAAADSSHDCHANSRSHSAYLIQKGSRTAPFVTHSAPEASAIGLSPCEAEYLALGRCAQQVLHFRQFAADIRFPQNNPTVILEDNKPAINLTVAPQITRKLRHIALKEHYIRWLYKTK